MSLPAILSIKNFGKNHDKKLVALFFSPGTTSVFPANSALIATLATCSDCICTLLTSSKPRSLKLARSIKEVLVGPGEIQVTETVLFINSILRLRLKESTKDFVAAYTLNPGIA